ARRLSAPLGLKLIEKKVIEPDGATKINLSSGFPHSGLDKYIGKLVRMGEDVEIVINGEIVEEIRFDSAHHLRTVKNGEI
ncbi:MAG: hypothetical protein J7M11_02250, partial [Elusimicrobia bacterium]|nr:hypothetical protein [Elusimicrobiota bacterium]